MIINDREKYEEIKSTISMKNLRKLIDDKEYTIAKVATNSGVSVSTINGYISGDRYPSVTTLVAIADYLNCNTDFLLGRTFNPENMDNVSSPNPNIDEILYRVKRLPVHKIELVLAYVKGLLDGDK